ncbi:hypothetical protein PORCAN_1983 [Porphyromonas crevioricanis JCM 13913]|nr:hypothetical protein PORCAN_1983 [Porphyromonas crevioricanis JCM 13913]
MLCKVIISLSISDYPDVCKLRIFEAQNKTNIEEPPVPP